MHVILKILSKLLDRSQRERGRGNGGGRGGERGSFSLHSVMYSVTFLYRRARSKFASWTAISVDVMTMQLRRVRSSLERNSSATWRRQPWINFVPRASFCRLCLGLGSGSSTRAHLKVVSCVVSPSRIPISRTRSREAYPYSRYLTYRICAIKCTRFNYTVKRAG